MSNGFVHSVKVPRIYKATANIVRRVCEEGASLKSLIYEQKHNNVSGIYALSVNTLHASSRLDVLFQRTKILIQEPRLNPWLAKVLVTELLWGKQHLSSCSKPIQTILIYADRLREESQSLSDTKRPLTPKIVRYVRINTLLSSVERILFLFQEEGWELLPRSRTYSSYLQSLSQLSKPYFIQDFHISEVLAFPSSTTFHEHSGYKSGELILQDKASCLPAYLLDPVKDSVILDFCAAPGMKATHLAAKLQNNGKIIAVEIDNKRFKTLCDQIEKTHSSCIKALNQDVLTLDPKQYQDVEYILVDPSCSGSGIIDRPHFSKGDTETNPERLQNLRSFQVYLLRHALFNFPAVKKVVYSTCSLQSEENEQVIDEVLADIGDAYKLMPIKDLLKDNWTNFSSQKYKCGDRCLYSRPDIDFCTGFFMAVFERNFEIPLPECWRKGGNVKSFQNINVNKTLDNLVENISRKRKKRGKKKNNKNTSMDEEQETKVSEDIIELEMSEGGNEKIDEVRSEFNIKEVILDEQKDVQKSLEDTETRKSKKKKKSKQENIIDDNIEIYDKEKQEQNEEIDIKSLKRKKEKKKKKMMKTEDDIKGEEKDEKMSIDSTKHKKKKKKKDKAVEIDNAIKKKEHEEMAIKSPKKRKIIEINAI